MIFVLRIWFLFRIFIYRWKHGKKCHYFCSWYELICDVDNENKNILIFGEGPTQWLDDMTLKAEAKFPINFTQPKKRFY